MIKMLQKIFQKSKKQLGNLTEPQVFLKIFHTDFQHFYCDIDFENCTILLKIAQKRQMEEKLR